MSCALGYKYDSKSEIDNESVSESERVRDIFV